MVALKTVIYLAVGTFFVFLLISVVGSILRGTAEAGNELFKIPGADLFKPKYISELKAELNNNKIDVSWKLDNEKDVQAPRVYYANNPLAFSPEEVEIDYSSATPGKGDLAATSQNKISLQAKTGISKIGIAVFDKNNRLKEKKEITIKIYNQNYLDNFNMEFGDSRCSQKEKCNIIKCKEKHDLLEKSSVLALRDDELIQLVKNLNTKCKIPISRALSYYRELKDCNAEEISKIFEDALTLKAQQKQTGGDARSFGAIRQDIYEKTFARQCVDTFRTVLNENGWREIK